MTQPIRIRQATPNDAETIAAFNRAMARETEGRDLDTGTVLAGVQRILADPTRGMYYVAEHAGRVVGQMLITTEASDWRDGVFWWIQSVYVAEDARSQGVYTTLHQHAEAAARIAGDVCGLRLYVEEDNLTARRVYERMGMHRTTYALYEVDWSTGGESDGHD